MAEQQRRALAAWSDESLEQGDGTYAVAVCEADKPGYWTLDYRLPDLAAAQSMADAINNTRGLTPAAALDIRASSMAAHMAGWRASDDAILEPDDEH